MKIAWVWSETLSVDFWINQRRDSFSYVIHKLSEENEVFVLCKGEESRFIFTLPEYSPGKVNYIITKNIVHEISEIKPDAMIFIGFNNEFIVQLKSIPCKKIIQDSGGHVFSADPSIDSVVVTRHYQSKLTNNKLPVVIPCGADTNLFRPSNMQKRWDVVCVANNFPVKRIPYLIEAQNKIGFKMAIIGNGHPAYGNNIDSIGKVPNSQLPVYLNQSKVFSMVSTLHDTGPRALSEALSCGLPCITLDDSLGISSLIKEADCGIVSPFTDFPNQIQKLLTNETLRTEYGTKAREYAEKHLSYKVVYQQWRDLIYGLCNK